MANSRPPYLVWMKEKLRAIRNRDIVNLASSGITTDYANHWQNDVLRSRAAEILSRLEESNEYGLDSLKAAIRSAYSVPQSREIVLTSGASGGIRLVCEILLAGRVNAEVVVESPTYEPLWAMPARFGAKVHSIERRDLASIGQRPSDRTAAVILSNLHNPTGHCLDRADLADLVRGVETGGSRAAIVIDEVYLDAGPQPGTTAATLGRQIVTISSLSKSHGLAALRCGWITVDPAFLPGFVQDNVLFQNAGCKLTEILGAMAVEELGAFRRAARDHMDRNRPFVESWLAAMEDAGHIEAQQVPPGCIMFPRLTRASSTAEIAEQLERQYGVLVVPGQFFGDAYDQHLRISFSGDHEHLQRGLDRLSKGLAAIT